MPGTKGRYSPGTRMGMRMERPDRSRAITRSRGRGIGVGPRSTARRKASKMRKIPLLPRTRPNRMIARSGRRRNPRGPMSPMHRRSRLRGY